MFDCNPITAAAERLAQSRERQVTYRRVGGESSLVNSIGVALRFLQAAGGTLGAVCCSVAGDLHNCYHVGRTVTANGKFEAPGLLLCIHPFGSYSWKRL